MAIKWKSGARLNPQVVLDRIESSKSVSRDGRVSYSAFDYHEAFAAVFSLLDIPKAVSKELDVDELVSNGLASAARAGIITKDSAIFHLNAVANNMLSVRESSYHLLTSLSINGSLPFRRIEYGGERIRVIDGDYPKKYSSRNRAVEGKLLDLSLVHDGYSKIIVSSKSKSIHGAASKALDSLDSVRALISLFSNSSMELMGSSTSPINKVRNGQVHTLHADSGQLATSMIWYEPNFVEAEVYNHKAPEILHKNFKWSVDKIGRCKYRDVLEDALLKYVRALDEKDHNSAAVRLWGALETLASPGEARYENITKRCSFLFEEAEYHRQILEHLKGFRNRSVHSGYQSDMAKTFCYQMQFYFRQVFIFHLHGVGEFSSLDELNEFLDLPVEASRLLSRKKLLDKAMRFRKLNF
ncbi:hypothetical protein [Halomonas sp. 3H]|uniref:hypothetical protein n=1 Tax=Halomonas sp. 3H TaxID=2952527 RepID=UPI0020B6AA8A|nr:hypothetical protein [Halomonas sp. 3H]